MKTIGSKYLLRNIHPRKMDVVIGDLYYKIPYGGIRNLLSPTARLKPEDIQKSRESGAIAKRIQQGILIEVECEQPISPPKITLAKPNAISFPQRARSSIVIEVSDYEDQDKINEDDPLSDLDFFDDDVDAQGTGFGAGLRQK